MLIDYDPESGDFRWRRPERMGQVAGKIRRSGYRVIKLNGREVLAHRLAFLLMLGRWPEGPVDHIDGVRDNNRWANLRECTALENQRNRRMPKSNTSGVHGVTKHRGGKWQASIKVLGRNVHLGLFENIEDAARARREAMHRYNFHPNHGVKHE